MLRILSILSFLSVLGITGYVGFTGFIASSALASSPLYTTSLPVPPRPKPIPKPAPSSNPDQPQATSDNKASSSPSEKNEPVDNSPVEAKGLTKASGYGDIVGPRPPKSRGKLMAILKQPGSMDLDYAPDLVLGSKMRIMEVNFETFGGEPYWAVKVEYEVDLILDTAILYRKALIRDNMVLRWLPMEE